jgi:hypothetical protein
MQFDFDRSEIAIVRAAVAAYFLREEKRKIRNERPSERAMRLADVQMLWDKVKEKQAAK